MEDSLQVDTSVPVRWERPDPAMLEDGEAYWVRADFRLTLIGYWTAANESFLVPDDYVVSVCRVQWVASIPTPRSPEMGQ